MVVTHRILPRLPSYLPKLLRKTSESHCQIQETLRRTQTHFSQLPHFVNRSLRIGNKRTPSGSPGVAGSKSLRLVSSPFGNLA